MVVHTAWGSTTPFMVTWFWSMSITTPSTPNHLNQNLSHQNIQCLSYKTNEKFNNNRGRSMDGRQLDHRTMDGPLIFKMDLSIFFAQPTQCKSTNKTNGEGGCCLWASSSPFFSSALSSFFISALSSSCGCRFRWHFSFRMFNVQCRIFNQRK